jgi:hypothetical protein
MKTKNCIMKGVLVLFFLFIFMFLLAGACSTLLAQTVTIGPTAAFNWSSQGSREGKAGVTIGVAGEVGLPRVTKGLYLDWGVTLSTHSWETDWQTDALTKQRVQYSATPAYLSIPIHIGYKYALTQDVAFFGSVGPYFGIGLFGKEKQFTENYDPTTGALLNTTTVQVHDNVFADCAMKRFDFGLGIKVGAEFINHIRLALSYDFGLTKTQTTCHPYGGKNNTFRFSYTYLFRL